MDERLGAGLASLLVDVGGHGETAGLDRARFVVPAKGPTYYASWVAVVFFGALMVVFVFFSGSPVAVGAVFGFFVLLGLAGVLYFRRPRTFEADLLGIRVSHGTRIVRDIPWTEVKRVHYGTRMVALSHSARPGPFITVTRHGAYRGIDFDTQDYPGHWELDSSLAVFAGEVARLAEQRGIPTQRKDVKAR